jgi:hypothetical protein
MKWTKVGTIRKSQKKSLYLKLDEDLSLKKGAVLQLQDPRVSLDRMVQAGKLTEDKAKERLAKIPDYIRQEVYLISEE